ncbi:MAG: hypothetical protein LBR05_03815 [Azoarcus sp.]|jgi:hypothetical protein|nr:hypothetical protein [Azoarcus sp.]
MSTLDVLTALAASPLGQAIGQSNHLVGATAQVFHILGFVALLASVVFINLRLLGRVLPNVPLQEVVRLPVKFIWWGFGFASVSGLLMFIAVPTLYYANPAFILKLVLYVLAIVFQIVLYQYTLRQKNPEKSLVLASVALSVILWFGVGLAGRAIGYV